MNERPDDESQIEEDKPETRTISRRTFLKWTAAAGVLAGVTGLGALSTLGYVYRPPSPPPAWEIAPGVIDYGIWESMHPLNNQDYTNQLGGPTPNVLKVAQWYDYWPGSFITDFVDYMKVTYNLSVDVQVDIYTSNEELFEWITLGGKKYDVMFPTNHIVDTIKKGGFLYNLNLDWISNFNNLWTDFIRVPHHVDSPDNLDQRQDPNGLHFVGIPYFFGTTGIAFRSDVIPKADVEEIGLDFFTMSEYTTLNPGTLPAGTTVTLKNQMRMLEDLRDVFTFGFKAAGWADQQANNLTPSPYIEPYTDTNGVTWPRPGVGTQWTSNETDSAKVGAMRDWLFRCKPNLFDFNSTGDTPSLIAGLAVLNQAWSGDIAYAQRPDQNNPQYADYVVPKRGSRWWQDTCTIHSASRNIWLAHQFINFIHSVDAAWPENQKLTRWNLYPTPNKACYDYFWNLEHANGAYAPPTPIWSTGSTWIMTDDARLYPNIKDPDTWARCDLPRDVGFDALINKYNPLWFDLTSE